jgi:hypothetical protein
VSILDPNHYQHEQASNRQTSPQILATVESPVPYMPCMQTQQSVGAPGMHPASSSSLDEHTDTIVAPNSSDGVNAYSFVIYNLPFHTTIINMLTWFEPYGSVHEVRIIPALIGQHVVCSGTAGITLITTVEQKDLVLFRLNGAVMFHGSQPIWVCIDKKLFILA